MLRRAKAAKGPAPEPPGCCSAVFGSGMPPRTEKQPASWIILRKEIWPRITQLRFPEKIQAETQKSYTSTFCIILFPIYYFNAF